MLGVPVKPLLIVGGGVVGAFILFGGGQETAAGTSPAQCEFKVTADVLNVREGPGKEFKVVGKLRQNAQTGAQGVVERGFRKLADGRWASQDFLNAVKGNGCQ